VELEGGGEEEDTGILEYIISDLTETLTHPPPAGVAEAVPVLLEAAVLGPAEALRVGEAGELGRGPAPLGLPLPRPQHVRTALGATPAHSLPRTAQY
jgi:hypothetical protein